MPSRSSSHGEASTSPATTATRATVWTQQAPDLTALDACTLGWSVIPLDNDKRPCKTGGAHPDGNPKRLGWKRNQEKRATPGDIKSWKRYHPAAWAVVTGAISNLVILDFDGDQGRATMEQLGIAPHVRTGSGGYHVYFVHPGWPVKTLNSKSKIEMGKRWPGLDIRADGGYAAFCGKNTSGAYTWLREPDPESLSLLPDDLQAFLGLLISPDKAGNSRPSADTLIERALATIGQEGRNNAGMWLACQLRDNDYSQSEADKALLSYASRTPTYNTKGQHELYTDEEAKASVRSAFSRPAREAWKQSTQEYRPTSISHPLNGNGASNGNHSNGATIVDQALCEFDADDSGNGDAMQALFGQDFLWCSSRGWFVYTSTHWQLDPDGAAVKRTAVETLRKRRHAAVDAGMEAIVKCTKADESRVNGCVNRFKTLVSVSIDAFDSDPDVLNCKNGVVNLCTGNIKPHDRAQRFTYCLPVKYEQEDCAEWLEYLEGVVGGGQEVIDYLQEAIGYSLTGHTREEILFYLFGPTRSGKGTLAETCMSLLPTPLSTMVDFNSFTAKREGDVSNFDLAPLKPARMIFASESNRSQSLNPAKIKQLTGGDLLTCCFKHRDFFSYRPQFKVWMMSNHPVNGDPEDDALWGRVRVIEFPNSFLGKEDKSKKTRLKEPEALTGILYWAVQGAIKWFARGSQGLITPDAIAKTTQAQRDELDYVQQWLDECCEENEGGWVANEDVIASYSTWCENNNVQFPKKAKGLAQSLKAKGYVVGEVKKIEGKVKRGVGGLYVYPFTQQKKEGQ